MIRWIRNLLWGALGLGAGFTLCAYFGLWFVIWFAAFVGVAHWTWFHLWHIWHRPRKGRFP